MVRLSSPLSSRLILAGSYAIGGGILLYLIFWALYGRVPIDETSSFLYRPKDQNVVEDSLEFIVILGPMFGILVFTTPFLPFTFAYACHVCPSRITITNTEIRAKFFTKEKRWPMAELNSVNFQTAGQNQFIILQVAGKTLKAEIEHGRWGPIRDLLPASIAKTAPPENKPKPLPQPSYAAIDTLSYVSEDEFEDDYRAEIYEQATRLAADYDWWQEPLWLYDQLSYPNQLAGQSILCRPNPVDADAIPILGKEIPARENALMSFIDAQRIVGLLQILSAEHEITWTLYGSHGNDPIGTITNGAIDPRIDQRLNAIKESNGFTAAELQDEVLQKRIRDAHTEDSSNSHPQSVSEYLSPPEQEIDSSRKR